MNKFFENYLNLIVKFCIFGVIIFLLHWAIVYSFLDLSSPKGFWHFHLFLFSLTLISNIVVAWLLKKDTQVMGYGFMASGFLKMILSIVFLLPYLLNKDENTLGIVIQFMCLYVVYLVFEVILLTKLLK